MRGHSVDLDILWLPKYPGCTLEPAVCLQICSTFSLPRVEFQSFLDCKVGFLWSPIGSNRDWVLQLFFLLMIHQPLSKSYQAIIYLLLFVQHQGNYRILAEEIASKDGVSTIQLSQFRPKSVIPQSSVPLTSSQRLVTVYQCVFSVILSSCSCSVLPLSHFELYRRVV